jgi:hypothetical protein
MRKMCTLITSKGTDIDENIANQNHATRTRTPNRGILTSLITKTMGYILTRPQLYMFVEKVGKLAFVTANFPRPFLGYCLSHI